MINEIFNLFKPFIINNCNDSYQFILNYENDELVINLNFSERDYNKISMIFDEKIKKPIKININKY